MLKTRWTELYHGDCFDWLREREANSIHAVVTDPPYGLHEFDPGQLAKLRAGNGGIWRQPPTLDGSRRRPLPRFTIYTAYTAADRERLHAFFLTWGMLILQVLVPGAHVLLAINPLLAPTVIVALQAASFEYRGQLIRLVTTLRGGDRPKSAEREFPDVTVLPRSRHEPWGIFRKPFAGTVAANLRRWGTGGFRRSTSGHPFSDVYPCPPATKAERAIASHPALKPQRLLRHIVRAVLPCGQGTILDPFAGSGSTLAAAEHLGYHAIGVERDEEYVREAIQAIPRLAQLAIANDETQPRISNSCEKIASCPDRGLADTSGMTEATRRSSSEERRA